MQSDLALSRVLTFPATQAITDDHGDTLAAATLLNVGNSVSGNIGLLDDVDAFKVTLQAGISYVFSVAGAGAGVSVRGATVRDLSQTSYFTPTLSGDYAVKVFANADQGFGAYTLTAKAESDGFAELASKAASLILGGSSPGVIDSSTERDLYAIELVAGTTYWFDAAFSTSSSSNMIRVRDTSGNQGAVATFTSPSTLSFKPVVSGKYFVEVSGANAISGAAAGQFTVSAKIGVPDDFLAPSKIPLGTVVTGKYEVRSDTDTFHFDLEAGGFYRLAYKSISATGTIGQGPLLTFTDLDFTDSFNVNGGVTWFQANVNATYEVNLRPGLSTAGYSLAVERLAVDDYPTKGNVPVLVSSASGTLEIVQDTDTFTLQLAAGQKINVSMLAGAGTPVDLSTSSLTVWGSDPGKTTSFAGIASGAGPEAVLTATSAGLYSVRVSGKAAGSYTLKVTDYTGDVQSPAVLNPSNVTAFNAPIALQFSEKVLVAAGALPLIYDSTGKLYDTGAKLVPNGSTVQLVPSKLLMPGETYKLSIGTSAIYDPAGNSYSGGTNMSLTVPQSVAGGTTGNDVFAYAGQVITGGLGLDTVVAASSSLFTYKRLASGHMQINGDAGVTLQGIERMYFAQGGPAMAFDTTGAGVAGSAYRLYQAAFDRTPDQAGVGYWMSAMDKGMGLRDVAAGFVSSAEFTTLYGANSSNLDFITRLYANVLNRPGETAGIDYWVKALDTGYSRIDALVNFSEGFENTAAVALVIGNGFAFIPYG